VSNGNVGLNRIACSQSTNGRSPACSRTTRRRSAREKGWPTIIVATPITAALLILTLRAAVLDGALLVGHHHGEKIAIDVSAWFSGHGQAHFADGYIALD
jgi:hypothetical protein